MSSSDSRNLLQSSVKNLQPNRFSPLFISKCVLVLFCVLLFHSRQINVFETCRFFFSLSQEFFLINDVFDALFMVAVAISSMFCGLKVFFLSLFSLLSLVVLGERNVKFHQFFLLLWFTNTHTFESLTICVFIKSTD